MPAVPETKSAWTNNVDALDSTNLNAYLRDPIRFLMDRPAAMLRQTAAQSIPTGGSFTPVTFGSEVFDDDPDGVGGHSTSSNTSRYTVRYPGIYLLGGGCGFAVSATGVRGVAWLLNGAVIDGSDVMLQAVTTASTSTRVPARQITVSLAEGDYVELGAFQTSGGALNTVTGSAAASMSVTWMRLVP
ncbi:hypothetical protein [Micromonospora sp. ATCC 39149]|uniref:hypothetical protein n=1 Tax=Micromonospora sp. (strain ATCC 39149 / NRRL 15099 / SCC 1413) TaxID=219305 RepID=UPI0002FE955D|nr:hypothetical protein [Micromonospora sp. ATCC 39149]